jgi:hypothetical protein
VAGLRDFTPCAYLPVLADHILAIGWLDREFEYPTGWTSPEVFNRLLDFCRNPWQPFISCGLHKCNLCQHDGEKSGTANLFIPFDGRIFVCPELITHYINAHFYSPPDKFCEAVLECPAMDSMEYKRLMIACNGQMLWQIPHN